MRVSSIKDYSQVNLSNRRLVSKEISGSQNIHGSYAPNIVHINFTGGPKNLAQIASFTPENMGLGLPEAYQGGEGVVGYEAIANMRQNETVKITLPDGSIEERKVDIRNFMPFWEHDNEGGGYKFLIHRRSDYPQGKKGLPDVMPAKNFYSARLGETLEDVAAKLGLETDELSYVIQSKPNGTGESAASKYCLLDPTSIQGKITRLSDRVLGDTEDVPYRLFKVSANNPSYNKIKGEPHYFVYTPQLARASKPYAYDRWGNVPFEAEIVTSDWMRALADFMHSKMNTPEFDYYNPAEVWCHDRPAHTYVNHIANMSANGNNDVNGLKVHVTAHNPGRNYQGTTNDPFKFITVVGDASDAELIRNHPDFEILKKAKEFGIDSDQLTPRERQIARTIVEPYLSEFKDGAGTYNITKTAITGAYLNPHNFSTGTVSYTFSKEMKDPNMVVAPFLTEDYAKIATKDVLNGSTPSSLGIDKPDLVFGRGDNGLTAAREGFTPFTYDGTNINEVVAAREKNGKWLTNLIFEAGEKGQDSLNKLFFNQSQIADGHNIVGYISPMKDGDILIYGWGRADEQKGYPITTRGFLDFLKRTDISTEDKLKVKLITGSGPWPKDARDFQLMMQDMAEICKLDGGIYKHNIMHIDGFSPKQLVGCITYGMLTSRREICGITPLECKAAAVPYGTTLTGGPVDYTNPSNGFTTKEAVELTPEHYGLSWGNTAEEIDNARISRQAPQVSDIFKQMVDEHTHDMDSYIAKCKKNVEEKIDWHENAEYNLGKSANRRYLDDIFETDKGWEARNKSTLRRLTGKLGEFKDTVEDLMYQTKSKPAKVIFGVVLGGLAVATGVFMYLHRSAAKGRQVANKNLGNQFDKAA